jgi:hypothetical protein
MLLRSAQAQLQIVTINDETAPVAGIGNSRPSGIVLQAHANQTRDEPIQATVLQPENNTRPPLESLIQDDYRNVTGDPQFLLNFAILGFPKCGTSTMMGWLGNHPEALCFRYEVRDLLMGRPALLIKRLYNELPEGNFQRGYKNPADLGNKQVMDYFGAYWPKANIIVGLRHPVRWFESFYNFRVNNYPHMPNPKKLIGICSRGTHGVCTRRAAFHVALTKLGKTNMTGPEEIEMKQQHRREFMAGITRIPNKVFLYDTGQLVDANKTRSQMFSNDVQAFLGLTKKMPPLPHSKPGKKWDSETQARKDSKKIDICDSDYDNLRISLMNIAKPASVWIRKYFLESEDVFVSSRDYFEEIMESWMHDPCNNTIVATDMVGKQSVRTDSPTRVE